MKIDRSKYDLVFLGNERLWSGYTVDGAPLLSTLLRLGYSVKKIIVSQRRTRRDQQKSLEIQQVAEQHSLPLVEVESKSELADAIKSSGARAGVLAAFGRIVQQEIIDLFPGGIVNIHPSLLPVYRGPSPIEQAILDGASKTGVSLMGLAKVMDSGPVFAQMSLELSGKETKNELGIKLLDISSKLIEKHLEDILKGDMAPTPQDETRATYTPIISKENGRLDWEKSAVRLEREVRAYAGWPGSFFELYSQTIIVIEAEVVRGELPPGSTELDSNKNILIGTNKDVLAIKKLKPAGRNEMLSAAFIAGLRKGLPENLKV